MAQLLFHRHLRSDAAAGFVFTKATRGESIELLFRPAPCDHQAVEMFVDAGLDEQCRFDKRRVARSVALPFVELANDSFRDSRVDDGIEPIEFGAIGENQRGELGAGPMTPAVRARWAKFAEYFFIGRLAGLNQ